MSVINSDMKFYEAPKNPINPDKRNFVIGVPEYHENLFRHLKCKEQWFNGAGSKGLIYRKEIRTPEDFAILNQIINDLRTENSELFIDISFHKKPTQLPLREYINEFLRIKGIFSYYSFNRWFRVTVYPEAGGMNLHTNEPLKSNERMEYIFVPLLIRLKKNKVFDQFKSISYNNPSSTEFEVKPVNPKHFLRDLIPGSFDQKEKLQESTTYSSNSKYLVYDEPLPRDLGLKEEEGEEE